MPQRKESDMNALVQNLNTVASAVATLRLAPEEAKAAKAAAENLIAEAKELAEAINAARAAGVSADNPAVAAAKQRLAEIRATESVRALRREAAVAEEAADAREME